MDATPIKQLRTLRECDKELELMDVTIQIVVCWEMFKNWIIAYGCNRKVDVVSYKLKLFERYLSYF